MKYLKFYESYKSDIHPIEYEVKKWEDYLSNEYEIKEYSGYKIILIDDKIFYLNGPFARKNNTVQKIFNDISYKIEDIHKPSLRKAIKNWLNRM
jgi:hypothetical protein